MNLQHSSVGQSTYTDLNRLHKLKVGEGRDSEANVRQVAQEFESLFVSEMMKAMRSANDVLADDLFNSNESKTYRDMYDQQMAVTLTQGKGIGMADVLVRQMSSMQQPKVRHNPFADKQVELDKAAAAKESKTAEVGAAILATVEPENKQPLDQAKQPAEPALETGKSNSGFVHVADTAGIKFRRFTGITPPHLSASARKAAATAAGEEAGRLANILQSKQAPQKAAEPVAGIRSYNNIKQAVSQGVQAAQAAVREVFRTPAEFVETMLPMAEKAAQRLGVDPSYLVAQAALETGWGKHMQRSGSGQSSYNLFGIKSHGWKGRSASAPTTEFIQGKEVRIRDSFRQYDSFAHSFNDYVDFLHQNPRYQRALQSAGNAENYVRELQRAGYATDPQYANKISRIARQIEQKYAQTVAQGGNVRFTEQS